MANSIDQFAFLVMEAAFGVLIFAGCYFSYILPIKILQNKRLGHQLLAEHDQFPPSSPTNHISGDDDHRHGTSEPVLDEQEERVEKVIGYANCIGAGVFVAVCFMAVMPVVQEEYEAYFRLIHMETIHYPIAEFTTLIGFFLILFLEEFMSFCSNRQNGDPVLYLDDVSHEEEGSRAGLLTVDVEPQDSSFEELKLEDGTRTGNQTSHRHPHSHSHAHSHVHIMNSSGFSFFVLMFATSIHSIFEGMALGLIKDYTRAIHLFIGIILHECIVAVALGLNSFRMQRSGTSVNKFGLLFSSTIPVGIVVGVIVGYTPGAFGRLTSAVFQGLAAGTFLHVAFCELIPGELNSHVPVEQQVPHAESHADQPAAGTPFCDKRIFRVILMFLGFAFMSIVTLFIDH